MAVTKTVLPLATSLITYTTSTPFSTVLNRLHSSIVLDSHKPNNLARLDTTSLPSFATSVHAAIGQHDFMQFLEINHGGWMSLFSPPSTAVKAADGMAKRDLQVRRFVFGNPMLAITMLEHDANAGLWAPVELLLVEEETGGCRVLYVQPSGSMTGYGNPKPELISAAEVLDAKLEKLVRDITA